MYKLTRISHDSIQNLSLAKVVPSSRRFESGWIPTLRSPCETSGTRSLRPSDSTWSGQCRINFSSPSLVNWTNLTSCRRCWGNLLTSLKKGAPCTTSCNLACACREKPYWSLRHETAWGPFRRWYPLRWEISSWNWGAIFCFHPFISKYRSDNFSVTTGTPIHLIALTVGRTWEKFAHGDPPSNANRFGHIGHMHGQNSCESNHLHDEKGATTLEGMRRHDT